MESPIKKTSPSPKHSKKSLTSPTKSPQSRDHKNSHGNNVDPSSSNSIRALFAKTPVKRVREETESQEEKEQRNDTEIKKIKLDANVVVIPGSTDEESIEVRASIVSQESKEKLEKEKAKDVPTDDDSDDIGMMVEDESSDDEEEEDEKDEKEGENENEIGRTEPISKRRRKKSEDASKNEDGSINSSPKKRVRTKRTPEEQAKFEAERNERKLKKEEELKAKEEAKRKRDEEKTKKKEEKERELKRKEEEKKKKEEEKAEQLAKKEEERKKKEEDKKRKEEEKEAKKKAKEDEKKRKLEEEQKKKEEEQKKASMFRLDRFLSKKTVTDEPSEAKPDSANAVNQNTKWYMPFQTNGRQLALLHKVPPMPREEIERQMASQDADMDQLRAELKSKRKRRTKREEPRIDSSQEPRSPMDELDDLIMDDEADQVVKNAKKLRMKLLSFHENRRPSYYGTWSKESKLITGRRPFSLDNTFLDYELDSDAEWEDEPEDGEDLVHNSDGEEKEPLDDDILSDDEDDFLVPDGYFSADEGLIDGDDETYQNSKEEDDPEKRKQLKELTKKQIKEMSNKKNIIRPVLIGIVYDVNADHPSFSILKRFKIEPLVETPIDINKKYKEKNNNEMMEGSSSLENCSSSLSSSSSTPRSNKLLRPVPESVMPELVKFVHGNVAGVGPLVEKFHELHPEISKLQLEKKVKQIAVREKPVGTTKKCWVVSAEVLKSFGLEDLPLVLQVVSTPTSVNANPNVVGLNHVVASSTLGTSSTTSGTVKSLFSVNSASNASPSGPKLLRRITPIPVTSPLTLSTGATVTPVSTIPAAVDTLNANVSPKKNTNNITAFFKSPSKTLKEDVMEIDTAPQKVVA